MTNIFELFKESIALGNYNVSAMEAKIDRFCIEGKLTLEERAELLQMTADNANDSMQIDIVEKLKDLEDRVFALEHPTEEETVYPVWVNGYVTKQGETVQYDYNNDGTLDLLRYDGGRASTSLRPGKIDGWHVVDANGSILGTFYNGEFTPVE